MALEGEIGWDGKKCPDCDELLENDVHMSGAGYYIGTFCACGPNSRESDYFPTRESAEAELKLWNEDLVRPSGRDTNYYGGQSNGSG